MKPDSPVPSGKSHHRKFDSRFTGFPRKVLSCTGSSPLFLRVLSPHSNHTNSQWVTIHCFVGVLDHWVGLLVHKQCWDTESSNPTRIGYYQPECNTDLRPSLPPFTEDTESTSSSHQLGRRSVSFSLGFRCHKKFEKVYSINENSVSSFVQCTGSDINYTLPVCSCT